MLHLNFELWFVYYLFLWKMCDAEGGLSFHLCEDKISVLTWFGV